MNDYGNASNCVARKLLHLRLDFSLHSVQFMCLMCGLNWMERKICFALNDTRGRTKQFSIIYTGIMQLEPKRSIKMQIKCHTECARQAGHVKNCYWSMFFLSWKRLLRRTGEHDSIMDTDRNNLLNVQRGLRVIRLALGALRKIASFKWELDWVDTSREIIRTAICRH